MYQPRIECFSALVLICVLGAGCAESRALTIELQTDMVPELELGSVEISVLHRFVPRDSTAAPLHSLVLEPRAADGAGLRAGLRLTELDLAGGSYTLRALARRPVSAGMPSAAGTLIQQRDVVVTLDADRVVRIVLVGACGGVSCPGAADADRATECLNGECVDPRCDPSWPEGHPLCCDGPSCREDATCAVASDCVVAACAEASCIAGACIATEREGACGPDEYCDLTDGACAPRSGSQERDAGMPDAGPLLDTDLQLDACPPETCGNGADDDCDGALDCEDSDCVGVACDDDNPCTESDVCVLAADGGAPCLGTPREGSCEDDGNACTNDVCAGGACTHTPRDGPCTDDGVECTNDVCTDGECTHQAFVDGHVCRDGRCCGGACVDVLSTPLHCGVCGIRCPGTCSAGECVWASTPECRDAGFGPLASSYMGRCQCRCNLIDTDRLTCAGQCPGVALCEERDGVNACVFPP